MREVKVVDHYSKWCLMLMAFGTVGIAETRLALYLHDLPLKYVQEDASDIFDDKIYHWLG